MKHHPSFVRAPLLIAVLLGCVSLVQCECECVPMKNCRNNYGGEAVFDIRLNNDAECGHYLDVCCDKEEVIRENDQATPPSTGVTPTNNDPTPSSALEEFEECGRRNPEGIGFRITETHNETEYAEFPWMVALLEATMMLDKETDTFICGGSLIASNVVLTGAHCVNLKDATKLTVRAGEWDTQTESETLLHQDRQVESIIIHPNYNSAYQFNNIALLILKNPFYSTQNVQLICLPPQGTQFFDEDCFVTGWGKANFNSVRYQTILKKLSLPMMTHQNCEKALRTTRLGPKFKLHHSFVCAGGQEGVDACSGDGGSPLMCPMPKSPDRYYQAGIVAWGIGCGTSGIPGVYTKNSLYTEWINQQMNEYRGSFDG